jgi:hypothetical protein
MRSPLISFLSLLIIAGCSRSPTLMDTMESHLLLSAEEATHLIENGAPGLTGDTTAILEWIELQYAKAFWKQVVLPEMTNGNSSRQPSLMIEGPDNSKGNLLKMAVGLHQLNRIGDGGLVRMQSQIHGHYLRNRLDLIEWAKREQSRMQYLNREGLRAAATQWKKAGLITEDAFPATLGLITSNRKFAVEHLPNLISSTITFDKKNIDARDQESLKAFYEQLLTLIPDAQMDRFFCQIDTLFTDKLPPADPGTTFFFQIEITINGRKYQDAIPMNQQASAFPTAGFSLAHGQLTHILNQFLLEEMQDRRMVHLRLNEMFREAINEEKVSYLLVNQENYNGLFRDSESILFASTRDFQPAMDRLSVDKAVDELFSVGMLEGIDADSLSDLKREVFLRPCRDKRALLLALPNLCISVPLKLKSRKMHAYPVLLLELKRISRGTFDPQRIGYYLRKSRLGGMEITFEANDKEYKSVLGKPDPSELDLGFVDLANSVLNESGKEGKFFFLPRFGPNREVIFLRQKEEMVLLEDWGLI